MKNPTEIQVNYMNVNNVISTSGELVSSPLRDELLGIDQFQQPINITFIKEQKLH